MQADAMNKEVKIHEKKLGQFAILSHEIIFLYFIYIEEIMDTLKDKVFIFWVKCVYRL